MRLTSNPYFEYQRRFWAAVQDSRNIINNAILIGYAGHGQFRYDLRDKK